MFTLLTLTCLLAAAWTSNAVEESPTWPVQCGFHEYDGYPTGTSYHYERKRSERGCRTLCKSDAKCGMYSWSSPYSCSLFQHSIKLHEKMGLAQDEVFHKDFTTKYKTGSRSCDAEASVAGECDEYPVYRDGIMPQGVSSFFNRIESEGDELTATVCQNYCTTYSRCRSIRYWVVPEPKATYCALYNVTIAEGGYSRCFGACGTYEKYCP